MRFITHVLFVCWACTHLFAQQDLIHPGKGIAIILLEGEGVVHPLPRPPASRISVRVSDAKGLPIRGAVAVLEFPELGATAHFVDGSQVRVRITDSKGEASFPILANETPGKYQPKITVNYHEQTNTLPLNQENAFPYPAAANRLTPVHRPRFSRKALLLACGAGAVAIVAIIATHGHSGSTSGGITITPGTGTVGGTH